MGFGPGFDGVLSGGDSWIARRKAAEALAKSTGASRGEPAGETGTKAVKIKEEDEEPDIATTVTLEDMAEPNIQSTPEQFNTTAGPPKEPEMQTINKDMGDLSLGQYGPEGVSGGGTAATSLAPGPPLSTQNHSDLASVEWSYLDPQGNVQGKPPFLSPCPSQVTMPTSAFAFFSRTFCC
jgi:PERQ amino acid-rich with GYF domain-containing protein